MRFSGYAGTRLVIQRPDATAYDAVRAMESQHVGAVLVQDRGRLVGIVTDRDLALRVLGTGLDPEQVALADVMTRDVAALPLSADEAQALELMHARRVRRIPLLDGERVVGLVTLDDLLLTGAADRQAVAAVVRAQLAETAPLHGAGRRRPKPVRSARQARHAAHALQTSHRAAQLVMDVTGLDDVEQAMTALEVVAGAVARRLTVPEAGDFLSQLPLELRERLSDAPFGPEPGLTPETIAVELAQRLDLDPRRASELVREVGIALAHLVSAGEMADVRAQLPEDLRAILSDDVAHPIP